jgi:class 3 adenylate cyclase
VCRHTLLRPRDLMTIGERLAAQRPDERMHEERLKEAVNQAAFEIAHEYLAEIAPYLGGPEVDRLMERLPGHVLTRSELEALNVDDDAQASKRAFWALYRVGLLGYVQHDRVRGEWRQRFLRPGEAALESDGTLPPSTHYLIHPVLSDVIGRVNPTYLQRVDPANIVGYDRPWRDTERTPDFVAHVRSCCVLKADVRGFGNLMRADMDRPVRKALEDAVRRWAPASAVTEVGAGDAVLMADDDPIALAQTARHIVDDVYRAPGQPRLRVALHYGEIRTRQRDTDLAHVIVGGDAVLCASRVEPIVEPGQIWATEEFKQQLQERPSLWRTVLLTPHSGDDRFNVSKPGGQEPDLWVRLFRLEF